MSTTLTPKRKLHGAHADYGFRLPASHLEAMEKLAEANGWSLAEAMRRAVQLFLRENMDITDIHIVLGDESARESR
jgi:hypothetical protein